MTHTADELRDFAEKASALDPKTLRTMGLIALSISVALFGATVVLEDGPAQLVAGEVASAFLAFALIDYGFRLVQDRLKERDLQSADHALGIAGSLDRIDEIRHSMDAKEREATEFSAASRQRSRESDFRDTITKHLWELSWDLQEIRFWLASMEARSRRPVGEWGDELSRQHEETEGLADSLSIYFERAEEKRRETTRRLKELENELGEELGAGPRPEFQIYVDDGGEHRWRLVAVNGEVVASGEGYATRSNAVRGIATVRRLAEEADVLASGSEDS